VAAVLAAPARAAADAPALFAPPDTVVGERDGFAGLTVRLSSPAGSTVTVNYATANSTAGGGPGCNLDYVNTSGTLTFAPGETSKTVQVQILNCPQPVRFKSFLFNLAGAVNATIARASARVSIVDASTVVATPGIFVRDAVVDEKDGVALVPVLLGGPTGQSSNSTVTVDYATHDGTAVAGSDYTAQSGTLTFTPGQNVKTLAIPVADDGDAEAAERFTVGLSNPGNATIANGTGTVMIGASDAPAVASPTISAPPDTVVGEGDGYVDVPVRLSAPGTQPVAVDYATANSTARGGPGCDLDYVNTSGTLNFAPGETTKVIRIEILNCPQPVRFKSLLLNLSAPVNATIARASARVSIVDASTVAATPRIFVRDAVVDEKDGVALVPVLLGGPIGQSSNSTVTVDYATHDGTATAGSDYSAQSGTLTFAPGQTAKTLVVPVADDGSAEPAERFTVGLSNPVNAAVADGTGTVVIGASDAPAVASPAISAPPDTVVGEGDGYVDVPVRLTAPGTQPVAVNYATADSSAGGGPGCNLDYVNTSGTLNFAPGQTTKVIRIEILNCPQPVRFKSLTLDLSAPVNATIARASARVSIVDASTVAATPRIFVRDATVDEKDGVALVPVLLGGPTGQSSNSTVTVDYATDDGTATAGSDYTAESGTLSFAPGQSVKTLVVPIADDGDAEPAESFTVGLSNPGNSALGDDTGTVTIGASDAPPVARPAISGPGDTVVAPGDGYVDLVVRLSAPGTQAVAVDYATANITAGAGPGCNLDYVGVSGTLNFAPGETTKVVRVELLNCGVPSGFRTFAFNLTDPVNATLGRATAHVAIAEGSTLLQGIAVTPAAPSLAIGTTRQLTATASFSDASTLNLSGSVTWSSSAPGVATVDDGGVAHAVAAGTTTITATFGAFSDSTQLTVQPPPGPRPQTIAFAALPDRTYGDPDFAVAATASSGLPVGFAVAGGGCSMAGTTVHIAHAGSCTITAGQPGDSDTAPAASVSRTFAIARAPQTIAFPALPGRRLGDPDFVVAATASSGRPVSLTAAGPCTVGGTTVHLAGPRTCTLTASQPGDADHAAAPSVSRSFTIIAAVPECRVPNLVGRTLAAARSALRRAHCATGKVSRRAAGRRHRGRVISQSRRPGKVVAAGTKVRLVVGR
jgi:chitinase